MCYEAVEYLKVNASVIKNEGNNLKIVFVLISGRRQLDKTNAVCKLTNYCCNSGKPVYSALATLF